MRKMFTILTIVLFASFSLMAQKTTQKTKRVKVKFYWGLKSGLNYTHFSLSNLRDKAAANYTETWKAGFVSGMFVNIPVYKNFSVQPEFLYSAMGGNYYKPDGSQVKARYNFFSIPTIAKYKFCKHWAVFAGSQFDFLIQGKETTSAGTFKVSDNLKDFDIFAVGGLELWAGKHIVFQVKYMRGFNDIDYRVNGLRYYQEGVQGTFGVRF
jgi:hypothetical protein